MLEARGSADARAGRDAAPAERRRLLRHRSLQAEDRQRQAGQRARARAGRHGDRARRGRDGIRRRRPGRRSASRPVRRMRALPARQRDDVRGLQGKPDGAGRLRRRDPDPRARRPRSPRARCPTRSPTSRRSSWSPPPACCAASDRSGIGDGGTAVVLGAGSMGLLHLLVLRAVLPNVAVVMVDLDDDRLGLAEKARRRARRQSPGRRRTTAVRDVAGGIGVDAVFDTVGGDRTLAAGIELTRAGGLGRALRARAGGRQRRLRPERALQERAADHRHLFRRAEGAGDDLRPARRRARSTPPRSSPIRCRSTISTRASRLSSSEKR